MQIDPDELQLADAFLKEHFDRLIDWAVGDIRRCSRMNEDGSCNEGGALVGAFILWSCSIDYFGGLFTEYAEPSGTKQRYKQFIEKYMPKYDWEKVFDLRWSLAHYYSPNHFALYQENNLEQNKNLHLTQTQKGILLHLGWAVKDLEDGVSKYHEEMKEDDTLKIKAWKYYKKQLPIMPFHIDQIITSANALASGATGTAIQSVSVSGTVDPMNYLKGTH